MGQVLQLTNPNNWEQIYSQNHLAQVLGSNPLKYKPIPEIVFPFLLDRHILVISAESNVAPPSWRFAGFVDQRIRTGLTAGGAYDGYASQAKIYLTRNTLIQFPALTDDYALSVKIPYWIEQIQLIVWQYSGPVSDSTETALAALQVTSDQIKTKVDSL